MAFRYALNNFKVGGVTAEYAATSSPLLKRDSKGWLRGMPYAERIKFKIANNLIQVAGYAVHGTQKELNSRWRGIFFDECF